mgnify:CR=1 FL=1
MSLKKLPLILFSALSFILNAQKNHKHNYLNPKLDTETRLDLLMAQMSLEDKVYQMNQFVGIEHMKKAEKDLTEADLANNDTQGFYKGVFSKDVEAMTKAGKIGSFLHVLIPEHANQLQRLAAKSRLKIQKSSCQKNKTKYFLIILFELLVVEPEHLEGYFNIYL